MPEEKSFKYSNVWPKLTHDEKSLILVMGAIYPLNDAVRYIGRDRKWLYKIRQKAHVREAIDARNYQNTEDVLRLTYDDMSTLLVGDLSRMLDDGILSQST